MENNLRNTFKLKYDRRQWQSVLIRIMGDDKVNYSLTPKSIALTDTQLLKIEKVLNIGTILTSDRKELPVFEIHLKPTVIIERNRVTVNEIIKQYLIKDARDGAIAVFYYPDYQKTEWRFSFISPGAENSFFEELEIESTNSKRYSYVFGVEEEEHRTAARQFIQLSESKKTLNDFFEAFNVEKMSKEFFDEYKNQYELFIKYILQSSSFTSAFSNNEKTVCDFVKKLLGRIIFLYFIQKKGWLGASSVNYKDGDKNFLQNLFNQAANEAFYPNWLSKLFFDTLNKKRDNDDFELPDGSIVKIPFLNGGLFDKVNAKYDMLTFSPSLFQNLFNFLNRYNFTIYEDSPDDHTVAVDPEMLGHIFENLLEDNKDKGAFYTPKEIVQYMTQESLIEYLHTYLPMLDKKYLILLVKYKSLDNIQELKDKISDIDYLLDKVKICDPAIGSGAFPMGLLQEIFALKDLLMHEKGFDISDKARVKEHIIQNSIYGVDIEQGAVDIARLRFWLSLVVYEDIPKPLPNLDYKIVVGNSLLTKFEDQILHIDWEVKSAKTGKMIAADIRKELSQLSQKQKEYFESAEKATLNQQIRELKLGIIEKQIRFNQLQYNEYNSVQGNIFEGKLKRSTKQDNEVQNFGLLLNKIATLRANPDKELQFFDWKLNFPEVLNPSIAGDNPGFDIVIGNPPYIKEATNKQAFEGLKKHEIYQGKMDIWYMFGHLGISISKTNGLSCYIATNNWVTNDGASKFRNFVLKNTEISQFVDFADYKVFISAGIQTMIYVLKKNLPKESYQLKYSKLKENNISKSELRYYIEANTSDEKWVKCYSEIIPQNYIDKYITFNVSPLISRISINSNFHLGQNEIYSGIDVLQDFVSKGHIGKLNNLDISIGDGVFVLSDEEFESYNFLPNEKEKIKPYYTTKELNRYKSIRKNSFWIIYSDREVFENINNYPNIKNHLLRFEPIMTSINRPFGLHRSRVEEIFKGEKIMCIRKCAVPSFSYTSFDSYVSRAFLIIKSERISIKYLTALLNSKVIKYWLLKKGKLQGDNFQVDKTPLVELPLIQSNNYKVFDCIVEYIYFLVAYSSPINEYVPNSHIIETLEEIIDAMVFELYFPDDFEKAEIKIIEYVQRDFKSIEGLDDSNKKEVIHQAYQTQRDKHNEIRNNLKLMDIRLADIVMPIKNA